MLLIRNIENLANEPTIIGIASSVEKARECIINYLVYHYYNFNNNANILVKQVTATNDNCVDYKLHKADLIKVNYGIENYLESTIENPSTTYYESFVISEIKEDIIFGYEYFPLVFSQDCLQSKFWDVHSDIDCEEKEEL